ncbi:MAG: EFR1 family ferrodoxin [Syntrophomonadales bacterium]|jgi:ferredoxin
MNYQINTMYFSATGTTKTVVDRIAVQIAGKTGRPVKINNYDFTLPAGRKETRSFTKEDLLIIGVPVYAGRVPNVLVKYLNTITGHGALAVPVVLFGNRDYDDALLELKDILEEHGFTAIAAGAFVGEHSFSKTLGAGRPDEKDMLLVDRFAQKIYQKLTTPDISSPVEVKGNRPYRKYYAPKDENGEVVKDFRLISPETSEDCIDCKTCVEVCPMGSIDYEHVSQLNGICIKCCACIKKCPTQAKQFTDARFLHHKHELEAAFGRRTEPEWFV